MPGKTVSVDVDEDTDRKAAAPGTAAAVVDEDAPIAIGGNADVVDEDVNPLDKLPPHAVTNVDGSVTLPLLYEKELQIRKDGKVRTTKYTELTFHRLHGADQRAIASTAEDSQAVVAFARSTRISQAIMNALFDRMDAADIAAAGQVLNSFLSTSRTRTGR